ncbi:MAG: transcription termination/antitermination protein NusA [Ruminococcaceae bacterium]|nr:transcription termination/antitermination protein NusA [Oscillospiraceae bacterium]
MNAELFEALELLEKTKGIPVSYMLEKVEAALQSAFKKEYGTSAVRVAINPEKKDMRVYRQRTVVEEVTDPRCEISYEDAKSISRRYEIGTVVEEEIKTKNFGRISAQTAKQVIVQGIREAEKSNIIREYEKKREEVISAVVTKRDDTTGSVEVDTGTSTAWLQKADQIPGEVLEVGDRIRVFVTEVRRELEGSGPLVTLSRTHPNMLKRMFEADIPEIADGTVLIKGVAREAGSRSKIAVLSRDPEVDAVGACIGNRGMRIGGIVEELRGEKIDVIAFSEKPEEFIASALSPAAVLEVEFDGERSAKVIVAGDQLSLAIGKEGQNVRLAAKLTGCKIDIKGVKQN